MKLFNLKMPSQLRERLEAEKGRSGFTVSEITRRALDQYLESRERRDTGRTHEYSEKATRP